MPKTRGTGLLMAWTDIDPAHEDEFNRSVRAAGKNRIELSMERDQAFLLIMNRNDNAYHGRSGPFSESVLTFDGDCLNHGTRIAAATNSAATHTRRKSKDAMTA